MSGSVGKHAAPPVAEEPASKRHHALEDAVSASFSDKSVGLNPADCNLDFTVEDDGLSGSALHHKGFGYCWSGARGTLGIRGGKYCFGCKVIEKQPVDMPDTAPDQRHLCRVGVSRGDDNVEGLGETVNSFGYGGTGKFSNAGKFLNYGQPFGVGDTIICGIDLEARPLAKILFWKNGKPLGVAKEFEAGPKGLNITGGDSDKRFSWHSALFPHVLLKNVTIRMQFSESDGLIPIDGFKPWSSTPQDGLMVEGPVLSKRSECEVLMMVGLPASGKTTWAEKKRNDSPEKRYVVLGTNLALDLMKVPGLTRKKNYEQRFELLMDRATEIFNKLLERAATTNRNYILDQTNVYKSARKRKLRSFDGFQKIAVVIFPTVEELKIRTSKRAQEMGKEVPIDAVNEMKANFVLPVTKKAPYSEESFDEVWYVELQKEDAEEVLKKIKSELPPVVHQTRRKSNQSQSPASRGSPASSGQAQGSPGSWQMVSQVSPASYSQPSQARSRLDRHLSEQYEQFDISPRPPHSAHGSFLLSGERYHSPLDTDARGHASAYSSNISPGRIVDGRMPPRPYLNNVSPAYSPIADNQYVPRPSMYDPYSPLQGGIPAPSQGYSPHLSATSYGSPTQYGSHFSAANHDLNAYPSPFHGRRPRPY